MIVCIIDVLIGKVFRNNISVFFVGLSIECLDVIEDREVWKCFVKLMCDEDCLCIFVDFDGFDVMVVE